MIITSITKLTVLKVYTEKDFNLPFEFDGQLIYEYRFLVLAESTLQEFREFLVKTYGVDRASEIINYEYFYKISID